MAVVLLSFMLLRGLASEIELVDPHTGVVAPQDYGDTHPHARFARGIDGRFLGAPPLTISRAAAMAATADARAEGRAAPTSLAEERQPGQERAMAATWEGPPS